MDRIWKKRFTKKLDPGVAQFLSSVIEDERLIHYDIAASRAHIRMLRKQGMITVQEYNRLSKALQDLRTKYGQKKLKLHEAGEDIHMNIETQMRKRIGQVADKLHMARSRNDLIAVDMRLYTRQSVRMLLNDIIKVQQALLRHARMNRNVVIPGYTHLQQAQPVLWAFYLLSIFFKLQRDLMRLFDAYKRINVSSLGACALAGTAHEIDPEFTASVLGFSRFAYNNLDTVSDRDFLCEVSYCCAQIGSHLASFADDMIIYTTQEFAHIELDDSIATGSSIMPHKRNPDIFELIRGTSASLIGNMVALFSVMKGLPSAYNRDLQCTKGIFFDLIDKTHECLYVIHRAVSKVHLTKSAWATTPTLCCATNLVDDLSKHNYSFRQAYHAVAICARKAQGDVSAFIRFCAKRFTMEPEIIENLITPIHAVRAKRSKNSTGPIQVQRALVRAQRIIQQSKRRYKKLRH